MGSHQDADHDGARKEFLAAQQEKLLEDLQRRAEMMTELGKNDLQQGNVLEEWAAEGVRVQMLPEDPNGVLRISIGEHPDVERSGYCNFRGDQGKCIALLERVLAAMKASTP